MKWITVPMQIRSTIFLSGRVQGVGMRFAVYQIAQNRNVVGTVENLEDGRVKIVAEAESEEMGRFEADIRSISTGKIQRIERFDSEASLEFDRFSVTR